MEMNIDDMSTDTITKYLEKRKEKEATPELRIFEGEWGGWSNGKALFTSEDKCCSDLLACFNKFDGDVYDYRNIAGFWSNALPKGKTLRFVSDSGLVLVSIVDGDKIIFEEE